MNDPMWKLESARIARAISRRLPDISDVEPLTIVGEGFRSLAVGTAGGVLLRVGKSNEAAIGFELEMNALPVIRRFVDSPTPDPQWHVLPCDDFPFGALGYIKLPGVNPLPRDPSLSKFFIPELAMFMVALHAMPVEKMAAVGVQAVDSLSRLEGAKSVVTPVLADRLNRADFERVELWWSTLRSRTAPTSFRPSVYHHDLWHGNLLVDSEGHLSGVLDWSHVEVGDPANDFAAIYVFGEKLAAQLIDEYQSSGGKLDDDDFQRVQRYREGRELGGIAWAIENDDEDEVEAGINKLLAGPILT